MNVASLELCKELYELSEWNDTYFSHEMFLLQSIPAYDLGYLLRKLPRLDARGYIRLTKMSNDYHALYTINDKDHIAGAFGDTPEDAAARLAIELFKQGILTKETA